MCLFLPRLPTDLLGCANPRLDGAKPVVLYERAASALRLYAVNRAAEAAGLYVRQPLSDARAMIPGLVAEKADAEGDRKAFIELCGRHMRYSPIVAASESSDILIDITGAAHLFGGEETLLTDALSRLEKAGIEAMGAIAASTGAAWAGARSARRVIIASGDERKALAGMPVAALRLDDETIANLKRVGLKTVGQLYDMPRAPLAARFGARLSERLDQALGLGPDPLTPLSPPPDYSAMRRLAEPVSTEDSILYCIPLLADDLAVRLERDGKGGRIFELALYRVDNRVTRLEVRTSAPTRSAAHLLRLFRNRLEDCREDFDAGFGFDVIRLSARECAALSSEQRDALTQKKSAEADALLIDRLSNRLGGANVFQVFPVDTHIPEYAVAMVPALGGKKPVAVPGQPHGERPLRLLTEPEPIAVIAEVPDGPPLRFTWRRISYRVAKASPPERIEDEWWRGKNRPARDYYRIETMEGWRFWVFRSGAFGESAEWRLHGLFP